MLRIIIRRKWLVLLPFAVGLIAAPPLSGGIGGLVLGGSVAVLLESRSSRFSRETDVLRALSLPVLATIPLIESEREQQGRRWRRVGIGLVILITAATVAFLRLRF